MHRYFRIGFATLLVLSALALSATIARARTFSFGQGHALWKVAIKVCPNGFIVTATGGTNPGTTTAVKAVDATLFLPFTTPPYIRQTHPLPFTSSSRSTVVAIAANPQFQVLGTASFFFKETVAVGALVQTTVDAYVNDAAQGLPVGVGMDTVSNCTVPPPVPLITDLTGVNPIVVAARGNSFGNDGRASPSGADHLAIYCLTTGPYAGSIVVNGLDANDHGYPLADFRLQEIAAARPRAVSKAAAGNQGEVNMYINAQGIWGLEWTHGPWSPHEFKAFTCALDQSMYNKTPNQLKYPYSFGNDGRVAPNPADRVAVYCRIGKNIIEVMGINDDSRGFPLTFFSYAQVVAASPNPLVKNVPGRGSVSLQVDNDDNFFLDWQGSPWGEQTKDFKCRF